MSLIRRTLPLARQRAIHPFWRDAGWASVCLLAAWFVAWNAFGFSELQLSTPVVQSSDASATAYRFASTLEDGAYQTITRAGAPFGARLSDTPESDGLNLLLARTFGVFTDDPFALLNLFVLTGFALNALLAYVVYRRLGLSGMWAAAASLAFTLLPYHFLFDQRPMAALSLNAVLTAWLALEVVWRSRSDDERRTWRGMVVLAALACGFCGAHLAFFSCLAIAASGIGAAMLARSIAPLRRAGILVMLVLLATIVQLTPSWWIGWRDGPNTALVAPTLGDVEWNSLKMTPMLLPRIEHNIDALAKVRARYQSETGANAAKPDIALGVIGAFGLLLLLAIPLLGRITERVPENLRRASIPLYACILFATVGGFGSLFALHVTSQLHALNRVVPFVAFLAILASMVVLQSSLRRRGNWTRGIAAVSVAAVCIVDQAGPGAHHTFTAKDRAAAFASERTFYAGVESALPKHSMVLQLPLATFPQDALKPIPAPFDQFAGYLHTSTLHWSSGATPGRPAERWQRLLEAFPMHEQATALAALGFSAILLDRRGYADPAPIDAALAAAKLQASVQSEDATRALYPLPNAKAERYRAYALAPLEGWSDVEYNTNQVWMWSTGDASLRLANARASARPCYVDMELESLQVDRHVVLRENGRTLAELRLIAGIPARLSAYLEEREGERTLDLVTDEPAVSPGEHDPRMLAFRLVMRTPPLCR